MTERLPHLEEYLRKHIDGRRLFHSHGTANEAAALARHYGVDEGKAYTAGLLHDVAKGGCKNGFQKMAARYQIEVDGVELNNPELLHGKIGAAMVNVELNIYDEDILSAIRWHTTGRAGMSMLDKIVYIADLIEPSREFECIDNIRLLAYQDINEAMLFALDHVMQFIKDKGFTLHPNSLEAYEDILKRRNCKI